MPHGGSLGSSSLPVFPSLVLFSFVDSAVCLAFLLGLEITAMGNNKHMKGRQNFEDSQTCYPLSRLLAYIYFQNVISDPTNLEPEEVRTEQRRPYR